MKFAVATVNQYLSFPYHLWHQGWVSPQSALELPTQPQGIARNRIKCCFSGVEEQRLIVGYEKPTFRQFAEVAHRIALDPGQPADRFKPGVQTKKLEQFTVDVLQEEPVSALAVINIFPSESIMDCWANGLFLTVASIINARRQYLEI